MMMSISVFKKNKKMFEYLFLLLKNLQNMLSITIMTALLFDGLFNYNIYCVTCVPFPGLIFWIYVFECTYQCFRKDLEGRGGARDYPAWGIRQFKFVSKIP